MTVLRVNPAYELEKKFCGNGKYNTLLKGHAFNGTIGSSFHEICDVADGKPVPLDVLLSKLNCKLSGSDVISKKINEWYMSDISVCDELFSISFPFRTKDDKKLRNIRSSDILLYLRLCAPIRKSLVFKVLSGPELGPLDYIFVCNVILYLLLVPDDLIDFWMKVDIMRLGTWGACDRLKEMSDFIKGHRKGEYHWECLVELNCLAGYRNPPVEGFDVEKEARDLAAGGVKHDFPFDFDEYTQAALTTQGIHNVEQIDFRTWLSSGVWATSGASSEGYLEILDNTTQKVKKIKCRKNFVLDAESVDYLFELAVNATEQTNKTLLKCELGKIRLAVASDLGSYLAASYITYYSAGCYLNWTGVTLEEKVPARVERMMDVKKRLRGCVGVPFDWKGFDHQPETPEIQSIVKVVVNAARKNYFLDPKIFLILCNNVVNSFQKSTLITRILLRLLVLVVSGGLMSGHRLTSIIGNGYDSVVSQMVIDCCVELGESREEFFLNVQGDDANIVCKSKRQGLMIVRLFQIFGVEFGAGKFSVQVENTEYLRIWYNADRTFGYAGRTLPNLLQRKPWSNNPWSPADVMRGIWDKIGILIRRSFNSDNCYALWNVLSDKWCELHNLPLSSLSIPAEFGGFGIGLWDGSTILQPRIPTLEKLGFSVVPKTNHRSERLKEEAKALNINFDVDYRKMAQAQLEGVISSDDVPEASIASRSQWKNLISKTVFREITHPRGRVGVNMDVLTSVHWNITTAQSWSDAISWLKSQTSSYGAWRQEVEKMQSVKEYMKYSVTKPPSLSSWLRDNLPDFWRALKEQRKRGHMTDIINYMGGTLNLGETEINKDASDIFTRFAIRSLKPNLRRGDLLRYYSMMRRPIIDGFTANVVYRYCFGGF